MAIPSTRPRHTSSASLEAQAQVRPRVLFRFALTAVSVQYLHTGSPFGLFLFSLALFHFSEYLWTSIYHRRIMSWDCTCYLTRSALL